MGNGMREMQEMFTRIPGNPLEDSRKCSHYSGKCKRRFRGMFRESSRFAEEAIRQF